MVGQWRIWRETVDAMPRTRVVLDSGMYMHVTFKSLIRRFVDNVEFRQDGKVNHVRSASRIGHSDLGANRRRVEKMQQLLE